MTNLNLQNKILTFIEYCLKEAKFDYSAKTLARIFEQIDGIKYQPTSISKELSLLKKEKLISFKRRYKRKVPEVTRQGRLKISTQLAYKQFGHWDSRWRVVLFNIPEKYRKDRQALRKKLSELGFETVQKGVYISPYPLFAPIKRFTTDYLGIRQHLILMEVDKIDQEKKEIQNIWNLDEINQKYKKFIKSVSLAKKEKFWPLLAKQLEKEFAQIYQEDPHLPSEFLPKDWVGEKAYQIFKQIANSY